MTVREPLRDSTILGYAKRKLDNTLDPKYNLPVDTEFNRAFSWFANKDVPSVLQPLLQQYVKWTQTFLVDPRDTIFISHIIFSFAVVVPSTFLLLYRFNWVHAILHTVMMVVTIPPFILMLHCVSHKKTSKNGVADFLIHYILCPFYGQTWSTFYYHHVKHHHIEDNGPEDLSSTIWYDRDNWMHFAIYYFRFYFLIGMELPVYFYKKGKLNWGINVFVGEYLTIMFISSFFFVFDPRSVIFAWFVPLNFSRIGMMTGNWTQHAFLAQDDATNDHKTALTVVESVYNATAFNDGYHTSHHLNSIRHWQDHPEHFFQNIEKYKSEKVVIFRDCDYWLIWCHLMVKDYKWLANHYVDLTGKMTMDDKITFLRNRARRLTREEIAKCYPNYYS
ncbi:hypothetical protein HK103_005276 [Boothiomyces macroporosus]|uniref:Fatty acid desaturase domain-containing protein n=1 Tax=Boothiomyces macroporosus TaxID=261099 RepID=A0AAD5UF53_9FUNG|nr:hypothetical protein HK103_000313 [Boothiomyces macroporosus]KAJ3256533.1 hypothetical protein HK103_005276 [Boothiomyces macroporosus]